MNSTGIKKRNNTVDFFRGAAMLLVVFGHTLSSATANYQGSFFYELIWTLQMPMFMMISGFVTVYSREVNDVRSLGAYLLKRTTAYLLPWLVWTVVIRGLVFGGKQFLDPLYLLWHMDNGYWFLTSLWTICAVFAIGQFLSSVVYKRDSETVKTLFTVLFTLCGVGCVALIGKFAGMSFFGIKLSLYYSPFFLSGFVFGRINKNCGGKKWFEIAKEVIIAVSALAYVFLLLHFEFAKDEENIIDVALRMAASVSGCIAVFGLGSKLVSTLKAENKFVKCGVWIGIHSLEIYLIHSFVLSPIRRLPLPEFGSLSGTVYFAVNAIITLLASSLILMLINSSKTTGFLLFGKQMKKIEIISEQKGNK